MFAIGESSLLSIVISSCLLVFRSRGGVPVLLDEEEKERRLQERAASARAFKAMREEMVEKKREQDRLDRNAAKERQLQEAEELQVQQPQTWPGALLALSFVTKLENSEFTQQDGKKKRTAKQLCVTNVTRLLPVGFVVIFT